MPHTPLSNVAVLVTGASGFLGSHTCDRLLAAGAEVHATSRAHRRSQHPRLRWWQCDLTDHDTVLAMLREIKPDVVFHLAGRVTAAVDVDLLLPTFHSLLGSTVSVLVAATTVGCRRLVITGSLTEPAGLSDNLVPSSPYAAAKAAGTAYARMCHELYETPVVILRPFMTYGPGQHGDKVIPYVIRTLEQGTPPKLASGKWEADWIYIDDVIDGFMLAASRPGIDGCTIDLGSGALTSTRQVVEKLVSLMDVQVDPVFGSVPDRPAEQVRVADVPYARDTLGWEPRTSLDEGLARTVRGHRSPRQGAWKEVAS